MNYNIAGYNVFPGFCSSTLCKANIDTAICLIPQRSLNLIQDLLHGTLSLNSYPQVGRRANCGVASRLHEADQKLILNMIM